MTFNSEDFSHRSDSFLRHFFKREENHGQKFIALVEDFRAHQDAFASGQYMVTLTASFKVSRFPQGIMKASNEDELLRQLRYEGLRPEGKPLKLARLFNLTQDIETQIAMPAEQTLTVHLSEAAQQAYARYWAEVERKYAPPSKKRGTGSAGPR